MRTTFEKRLGRLQIKVSGSWPRALEVAVLDEDRYIDGLSMEEMRDLYYGLGRAITWVEETDKSKL